MSDKSVGQRSDMCCANRQLASKRVLEFTSPLHSARIDQLLLVTVDAQTCSNSFYVACAAKLARDQTDMFELISNKLRYRFVHSLKLGF